MVSMKSGLDGRNNIWTMGWCFAQYFCLNEVRPRWPEQCKGEKSQKKNGRTVSMKSGLDGRNNGKGGKSQEEQENCLNEVRPRWPEQWSLT